mgnify:CR=1 FL=1
MAGQSKRTFRCLRGLSWGLHGEHAYEPDDLIRDLPAEYVGWMLDQAIIEEATTSGKPA